jgi:hypothetical protein
VSSSPSDQERDEYRDQHQGREVAPPTLEQVFEDGVLRGVSVPTINGGTR